jgi:hypothetical protein
VEQQVNATTLEKKNTIWKFLYHTSYAVECFKMALTAPPNQYFETSNVKGLETKQKNI